MLNSTLEADQSKLPLGVYQEKQLDKEVSAEQLLHFLATVGCLQTSPSSIYMITVTRKLYRNNFLKSRMK